MRKFMTSFVAIICITLCLAVDATSADIVVNVNARFNAPPDVSQSHGEAMQFLTAGDYTFTLVNNEIGHSSYHSQANFTGWSFHTPGSNWGTNYSFAYDDNIFGNDTLSSPPFVGPDRGSGGNQTLSANALEAFDATTAERLSFQVHIPFDQTIGFYFSDNVLSDNAGGVSVLIQQVTVPEPSTFGFFGICGLGMAIMRRRRRSK